MLFVLALLYVLFVSSVSGSGEFVLRSNATLFSEVTSMHHDAKSRHVLIHLAAERKCAQPTFMVRLSGKSLFLLRQVHSEHTKPDTQVFSYPRLYEPGTYFLEVITIYCKTLDTEFFQNMCMIHADDDKHVLTLPYSFEVNKGASKPNHPRPRWVLRPNSTSAFLPTRYQLWINGKGWRTSEESDVDQHKLYEWTDKPAYLHLVNKTFEWGLTKIAQPTGREAITICMVGASHAHNIAVYGNNLTIPHLRFGAETSRYPQLFNVSTLADCSYAVLGYGQWPLSYLMKREPYNAAKYEFEMRRVLSSIAAEKLKTQVFTYSMNLCPMGYRENGCPAADHRQPPIVMHYNKIMANLSTEYNIPYIDLIPLQGPLWDMSLDWNHPEAQVFIAEAEFIIHSVLTYSHTHRRAPVLDANPSARSIPPLVTPTVRFTDSDTWYMLHNGVYRAFPNEVTKHRLGARWSTKIVNATERSEYRFGPPIPDL